MTIYPLLQWNFDDILLKHGSIKIFGFICMNFLLNKFAKKNHKRIFPAYSKLHHLKLHLLLSFEYPYSMVFLWNWWIIQRISVKEMSIELVNNVQKLSIESNNLCVNMWEIFPFSVCCLTYIVRNAFYDYFYFFNWTLSTHCCRKTA